MEFRKYQPNSPWDKWIKYYWVLRSDHAIIRHEEERFLPDGHFELIIDLADDFYQTNHGKRWEKRPKSFLAGLYSDHFYVRASGAIHSIGVLFQPGGVQYFVNRPFNELGSHWVELDDIFGSAGNELVQKISDPTTDEEKIRMLHGLMVSRFRDEFQMPHLVTTAIELILASAGTQPIHSLAEDLVVSPRHLRRQFRLFTGMGIKEFSRIIRIDAIVRHVKKNRPTSLTQIAHFFQYFDQSHFIHDFKMISGLTPSAYFMERHPIDDHFFQ